MAQQPKLTDLSYKFIVTDTESAVLVDFGDREQWIPKRVCEVDENSHQVTVETWFVEREDLEQYAIV